MKKGDVSMVTVLLILALVGAVVLLIVVIAYKGPMEKKMDIELCRASITIVALSKIGTGGPLLSLKCLTDSKELDAGDKNKIMEVLNQDILSCWNMWGAGQIDFTSNWDWGRRNTFCFVCSVLNFEKDGGQITERDLLEGGVSYKIAPDYESNKNFENLEIKKDNPLYVMYGVRKQFAETGVWGRVRFIFTLGSYKSGSTSFLIVTNQNLAKETCDGIYIDSKEFTEKEWLKGKTPGVAPEPVSWKKEKVET